MSDTISQKQHTVLLSVLNFCIDAIHQMADALLVTEAFKEAEILKKNLANIRIPDFAKDRTSSIITCVADAITEANTSVDIFKKRFEVRSMSLEPHTDTLSYLSVCDARFSAILWDMSLDAPKKDKLKRLLADNGTSLRIFEDVPAVLRGGSYEFLTTANTATIAFEHCYGFTFVEYKQGRMQGGYSMPIEIVNDLISANE